MGTREWRYGHFISRKTLSSFEKISLSMDAGFFEFPSKYFLHHPE